MAKRKHKKSQKKKERKKEEASHLTKEEIKRLILPKFPYKQDISVLDFIKDHNLDSEWDEWDL